MSGREVAVQGSASVDVAPETSVMTLLQMAVEKGDVGMMNELMDLRERVEKRDAQRAFFEAVASFQEQCPEIHHSKTAKIKTKSGVEFSYTYAPLPEITRTIRPALRDNGLSYSWEVSASNGVLDITAVLRHVDGHEVRSSFPVPISKDGRMSDAQASGAALTYGRRQSLIAVLGLTTADQDVDGAAPPDTTEKISDEELATLSALLDEIGNRPKNEKKLLNWLGVETLADVPAESFATAKDALEERRAAR